LKGFFGSTMDVYPPDHACMDDSDPVDVPAGRKSRLQASLGV
jgi:hypothetical protein